MQLMAAATTGNQISLRLFAALILLFYEMQKTIISDQKEEACRNSLKQLMGFQHLKQLNQGTCEETGECLHQIPVSIQPLGPSVRNEHGRASCIMHATMQTLSLWSWKRDWNQLHMRHQHVRICVGMELILLFSRMRRYCELLFGITLLLTECK